MLSWVGDSQAQDKPNAAASRSKASPNRSQAERPGLSFSSSSPSSSSSSSSSSSPSSPSSPSSSSSSSPSSSSSSSPSSSRPPSSSLLFSLPSPPPLSPH